MTEVLISGVSLVRIKFSLRKGETIENVITHKHKSATSALYFAPFLKMSEATLVLSVDRRRIPLEAVW